MGRPSSPPAIPSAARGREDAERPADALGGAPGKEQREGDEGGAEDEDRLLQRQRRRERLLRVLSERHGPRRAGERHDGRDLVARAAGVRALVARLDNERALLDGRRHRHAVAGLQEQPAAHRRGHDGGRAVEEVAEPVSPKRTGRAARRAGAGGVDGARDDPAHLAQPRAERHEGVQRAAAGANGAQGGHHRPAGGERLADVGEVGRSSGSPAPDGGSCSTSAPPRFRRKTRANRLRAQVRLAEGGALGSGSLSARSTRARRPHPAASRGLRAGCRRAARRWCARGAGAR